LKNRGPLGLMLSIDLGLTACEREEDGHRRG